MSWEKNFSQRGSVMVAIFASIAAVGVVGAVSMNTMKGPVRSMHNVTQNTVAENNMIAAGKLALMAAVNQSDNGDCDSDGTIEPIPFATTGEGPHPDGGGYLPNSIGAAKVDPWGNEYGYCVWDHGTAIHNAACGTNRLRGNADEDGIVIAVISSGPDRIFQTTCGNAPTFVNRVSGSDDLVLAYSYAEAATMSGGLWNIKAGDPGTAEINKDLEVRSNDGHVAFGVDTRSDANRPAIRVDYINRLSRSAVEFLSNINIDANRISGDGGNHGLSFTGARGNFSHGLDVANNLAVTQGATIAGGASVTGNIALPGNTTITKDTTARNLLLYSGTSQATGAGIQLYGATSSEVGRAYVNFGGSANPSFARFRYHNGGAWTNIMDIHSTGNIGVGNTNPQESLHTAGNLRADGRSVFLGASQRLYGDNSSALYWDSNNAASQIILRNNASTEVGRVYANTARIGLQEPGGTWSYRADYGASTMFYVDGAIRMRLYPDRLDMQGNRIRNMAAPAADTDAATRRYVDDRVAAGTGFVEQDPKIGGITNGRWCYATGSKIVCDRVAPVLTEVDPKVGTLTNNRWCRSDGSRVICDRAAPVLVETDPKIGTLTNGRWCRSNGSQVICDQTAPSGGGITATTVVSGSGSCPKSGSTITCTATCASGWFRTGCGGRVTFTFDSGDDWWSSTAECGPSGTAACSASASNSRINPANNGCRAICAR